MLKTQRYGCRREDLAEEIAVEVWEVASDNHSRVLDTFDLQTFDFLILPRKGEEIILNCDRIRPPVVYEVGDLKHAGCTVTAARAFTSITTI